MIVTVTDAEVWDKLDCAKNVAPDGPIDSDTAKGAALKAKECAATLSKWIEQKDLSLETLKKVAGMKERPADGSSDAQKAAPPPPPPAEKAAPPPPPAEKAAPPPPPAAKAAPPPPPPPAEKTAPPPPPAEKAAPPPPPPADKAAPPPPPAEKAAPPPPPPAAPAAPADQATPPPPPPPAAPAPPATPPPPPAAEPTLSTEDIAAKNEKEAARMEAKSFIDDGVKLAQDYVLPSSKSDFESDFKDMIYAFKRFVGLAQQDSEDQVLLDELAEMATSSAGCLVSEATDGCETDFFDEQACDLDFVY